MRVHVVRGEGFLETLGGGEVEWTELEHRSINKCLNKELVIIPQSSVNNTNHSSVAGRHIYITYIFNLTNIYCISIIYSLIQILIEHLLC